MGKEKKIARNEVEKSSRNGGKFDSVRQIDFRLWVPGFLAKAAARECADFFECNCEKEFTETRPCVIGGEDAYVEKQIEVEAKRIIKTYRKNVRLVTETQDLEVADRNKRILDLRMQKNTAVSAVWNTKDKKLKDLETSNVIFDKKERIFKVNRAAAVNLMYESLGSNCLGEIKDQLKDGKPFAAWNKLKERFDSKKGGTVNTANILDEMKDFVLVKKNGSIVGGIHYMKNLAEEYGSINSTPMDPNLTLNYLLDAIKRSGFEEFKEMVNDARKPGVNWTLEMLETNVSIIENRIAHEPGQKKNSQNASMKNVLKNQQSAEQLFSLLAAQFSGKKKNGKTSPKLNNLNSALTCTVCGRSGHTAEACWKNHICSICKKKGHLENFCFHAKPGNADGKKKLNVGDFIAKKT